MILGIGNGLFAIIFVTVLAIIITLIGAYVNRRFALLIGMCSFLLPFIVYGFISLAPRSTVPFEKSPPTLYNREQRVLMDVVLVDYFFFFRIAAMVIPALALIAAAGYYIWLVAAETPYSAPRVRCLREELEELHQAWRG